MAKKKIATVPVVGKKSIAPVQKESAQESRHKEGYVPLWKQYQQSEEFKDYKKNDMARANAFVSSGDGLSTKEREDLMAKSFQLRWVEAQSGKVQETKHNSEKSAKDKARELSMDHSPVQVGEVDEKGNLVQQWNYDKGRQQAMNTKKQVTIAPISKKEASQIQTNEKGTTTMATKSTKKSSKKVAPKTGKAPKVAPKGKTQPAATASGEKSKKTGTIRDQFGLREGTNRAKLVDALLAAKGKALPLSALLKATYGNTKEENAGAIKMVLKGVQMMIDANKIKLTLVKTKDGKEMTFALKAK